MLANRLLSSMIYEESQVSPVDECSIAVVVVGRNPGNFLIAMLESLVIQIDPPDEIIYYDDCSDDDSIFILESFRTRLPRLKVIAGKQRVGVSCARNRANSHVQSRYIAVLDADDYFLNNTIATYREAIRQSTNNLDLIYADTLVFRDGSDFSWRMHYPAFGGASQATWRLMASPIVPFKHSSILYRKSSIEKIGGYCEELPLKVDFDLFVRVLKSGLVVKKLDAATSHHRSHGRQISKGRIRGILLYWKIISWHESRFIYATIFKVLRALGEVAKLVLGR
jgi:glycosyltransferase involved in cell wall biosynthesis